MRSFFKGWKKNIGVFGLLVVGILAWAFLYNWSLGSPIRFGSRK